MVHVPSCAEALLTSSTVQLEFITQSQPFLWAQMQVIFFFLLKIQEEISVAATLNPVLVPAHISSHLAELIL